MKDIDFKGKTSSRAHGKGVMIIIVVLFTSLSFVLGYFVGKIGRTAPMEQAAETPLPQKTPDPVLPQSQRPEAAAQTVPQQAGPQGLQPAPQIQPAPQEQKAPAVEKETPKAAAKALPVSPVVQSQKDTSKDQAKGGRKETLKADVPPTETAAQKTRQVYTVQLGALKNAGEAKKLKARLEKKGFKAFLAVSKGKNQEKIYKIRIGDYKEKKEAEVLALRLKKSEGLKAFVTVKD